MDFENIDYSELEKNYLATDAYIKNVSAGIFRSLIINGPPGVGKTHAVEKCLKTYSINNYKMITGQMTPLSLYGHLYHNREAKKVLVLDDIDSVFKKLEGVNILKAAMDTKPKRTISWASPTHLLNAAGIPEYFDYFGGVILISNIGFELKTNQMSAHLSALKDRSYTISVTDRSNDALIKHVSFMVMKHDLLADFNLSISEKNELLNYMNDNISRLHTISLRVAVKLAMLMSVDKANWKQLAEDGLIK